jgi:AcrR family transcriptional regulator
MARPEFERARSAEAKHIREMAILDAAARLAAEHGVRAVTLTDIAAAVGMHKSAMLRYFETREEIFLRLSASGWTEWSQAVRDRLGQLDYEGTAGPEARIPAIASILATRSPRGRCSATCSHTPRSTLNAACPSTRSDPSR